MRSPLPFYYILSLKMQLFISAFKTLSTLRVVIIRYAPIKTNKEITVY